MKSDAQPPTAETGRTAPVSSRAVPPATPKTPSLRENHGDAVIDEYAWLASAGDDMAIPYLEAENAYTKALTAPNADLEDSIFDEIRARTQESDLTVPTLNGEWWYYTRSEKGLQHPLYCRCPRVANESSPPSCEPGATLPGEEVILDGNELVGDSGIFALGAFRVSPDGCRLAYSLDIAGDERFVLRIKDLGTRRMLADEIRGAFYTCAWSLDGSTLFYVAVDANQRPYRVWRHVIGTPMTEDVLIFEERDPKFWLSIGLTRSQRFLCLRTSAATTSEIWLLDSRKPDGELQLVSARIPGVYYNIDHQFGPHGEDRVLILHNRDAVNFELAIASIDNPGNWTPLISHSQDTRLQWAMAFTDHIVVYFRRDITSGLRVLGRGQDCVIPFTDEIYSVMPASNPTFHTTHFRFTYTSPVTPASVYDYDMETGLQTLLRRRPVLPLPGGAKYSSSDYEVSREWAVAADGAKIPITVVSRTGLTRDGKSPLVLYGYGSYERAVDMGFSTFRLSLLDRGFRYAVAHVRGGGDMGAAWHDAGKKLNKRNSFIDYIACARHLIARGWTSPEGLIARGTSAGGLLVGAALNMAPDLFAGVVARVPFVDPLTTMLDESLPLTIAEREEWGDPIEDANVYAYMKSYSPYENISRAVYPPVLAMASKNDTRVRHHEAAKWIARLRATADGGPFILKTELKAGHRGRTGRYDAWRQEAFVLAWIIRTARSPLTS